MSLILIPFWYYCVLVPELFHKYKVWWSSSSRLWLVDLTIWSSRVGESSCSKDHVTFTLLSYVFSFWMLYMVYNLRPDHFLRCLERLVETMIKLSLYVKNLLLIWEFLPLFLVSLIIMLYTCQTTCVGPLGVLQSISFLGSTLYCDKLGILSIRF